MMNRVGMRIVYMGVKTQRPSASRMRRSIFLLVATASLLLPRMAAAQEVDRSPHRNREGRTGRRPSGCGRPRHLNGPDRLEGSLETARRHSATADGQRQAQSGPLPPVSDVQISAALSRFPERRDRAMTNRTHTGLLLVVLAAGLAGCDRAVAPTPTAPSPRQQQTPRLVHIGPDTYYVADVTLSGVVYEMTPAGRVPIKGALLYSAASEPPTGTNDITVSVTTDTNGRFSVRPVWICPCSWAPRWMRVSPLSTGSKTATRIRRGNQPPLSPRPWHRAGGREVKTQLATRSSRSNSSDDKP